MGYLMLCRHGQVEGLQAEALRLFSCPEIPQTLGRTSSEQEIAHGHCQRDGRHLLPEIFVRGAGYHSERKDACFGNCSSHDSISEYKHITRERWEALFPENSWLQ